VQEQNTMTTNSQDEREQHSSVTRRHMLWGLGLGLTAMGLASGCTSDAAEGNGVSLGAPEVSAIQQLNARYFYAIDGLLGPDSAAMWADTFTADGTFLLLNATGEVVLQATGTAELISIYAEFPDIATTRHWINNLLLEASATGATGGCYIIAMDIQSSPASITRTGLYDDQLVKVNGQWRFQSRTLTLDASSSF
jgi:SnoaL-like protein